MAKFRCFNIVVLCFIFAVLIGSIPVFGMSSRPIESITQDPIAGNGVATQTQMFKFLIKRNPSIDKDVLSYLIKMYVVEARREGIKHDVAFAQMVLETNYLKFGNSVGHRQNNFAGIGSVADGVAGHHFDTIYLGIRVHIQHLAAYALTTPLKQELVDPRFKYVKRGSAPRIQDLTGRWAMDPNYASKIARLLRGLLAT